MSWCVSIFRYMRAVVPRIHGSGVIGLRIGRIRLERGGGESYPGDDGNDVSGEDDHHVSRFCHT